MIHIRQATPNDAKTIAPIMALAMTDILYFLIGKEDLQEATNFLQQLIASENNQYSYENIIVAHRDEEILGQACLYLGANLAQLRQPILQLLSEKHQQKVDYDDETQRGEIYLDSIAVSSSAQGQGIGKILLNHIIEQHIKKEQKTVGLLVDKTNPKAKALYLKIDFHVVGEKKVFGHEMEHLQYAPHLT